MDFQITRWNDWDVVTAPTQFVVRNLVNMRQTLEPLMEQPSPKVAFDLGQTRYIDSSAMSLILNVNKRLDAASGKLALFGPNEELQEIFSIVDLRSAVSVFETREKFESWAAG
jgi:anti-anti-sigma factor